MKRNEPVKFAYLFWKLKISQVCNVHDYLLVNMYLYRRLLEQFV